MARNLRSKIGQNDSLSVHDVNPAVTQRFAEEMGNVTVAKDVREVAEHSVSNSHTSALPPSPLL